eukprot:scaffold1816_cov147-Skeletonema_menzelii.AAC.5
MGNLQLLIAILQAWHKIRLLDKELAAVLLDKELAAVPNQASSGQLRDCSNAAWCVRCLSRSYVLPYHPPGV